MSNLNSRLNKLEVSAGIGETYKYKLVICKDWAAMTDTPEQRAALE